MSEIIQLTKAVWNATRDYNYKMKAKIPELSDFNWSLWEKIPHDMYKEYRGWVSYLLRYDAFDFSVEQRHSFAVANRLSHGWVLGEKRDNMKKIDPFLLPMKDCPEWLYTWCQGKDLIMVDIVKKFKLWYDLE